MAIKIKTPEQIELMRKSGALLGEVLALVAKEIRIGINGLYLDKLAEEYIRDNGGVPSFKGLYGCPSSILISVNEEVVHGIPNARAYKDGDILSVDAGVFMNGFHADSAYTFAVGKPKEDRIKLLQVTKEALYIGIENAVAGNRVGMISHAIQEYCERKHGYRCVRELVGHGLGRELHEDPQVPNFGKATEGPLLPENCVIAIEPMINMGRKDVYTKSDKWTVATQDHKPSAHFEHTVCVKPGKADILTTFELIEIAIKANKELTYV
jgi:methionyl aminopeptidase